MEHGSYMTLWNNSKPKVQHTSATALQYNKLRFVLTNWAKNASNDAKDDKYEFEAGRFCDNISHYRSCTLHL
jgi:hypothetical protein